MNTELKLQALLDGELETREVRELEALLAKDTQQAALLQELKWTKAAVAGNDVALSLPETRDFYWSKIAREIETAEKNAAVPAERPWWIQYFYPATGLAAMVALMFVISGGRDTDGANTESVPEDVNAVSFRSDAQEISVVYVADEQGKISPVGQEAKNEPETDK